LSWHKEQSKNSAKNVNVLFGDNSGDAKTGISEFRRMVEIEKVSAVVTTRSPVVLAINPISQQKKIPLVGISGHPMFVRNNRYAFRSFSSVKNEGKILAEKVQEKKLATISILTLEDDYFLSLSHAFIETLQQQGTKIVFNETIAPEELDLSLIALRALQSKPEAIFINVGPKHLGTLVKKVKLLMPEIRVLSNFAIELEDVQKDAGDTVRGALFVMIDYHKPKFLGLLQEKFSEKRSSAIGYSCFSGLLFLLQAIEKTQNGSSSESIFQSLQKIDSVLLPDEIIPVKDREIQFRLVAKEIF
jgi:ABC-type branched-subunit amino acid transport system substrate-binding protein